MLPFIQFARALANIHGRVALLAGMLFASAGSAHGSPHEVTVYSYFTDMGRARAPARSADMVRCRLFSAGYQEIGRISSSPPSRPPSAELVTGLLRDALRVNRFHCGDLDEDPALLLVCQWGHLDPPPPDAWESGEYSRHERLKILALVGGPLLMTVDSEERARILEAARDERFFVVVSAYDFATSTRKSALRLFWRTQITVPACGLTQEGAAALMIAAGATLFGRETPVPRRIVVNVTGIMKPAIKIE